MEISLEQQVIDQLKKAGNILIVLPKSPTADAAASSVALRLFLEKLDKIVHIVSAGPIPATVRFIPETEAIASHIPTSDTLTVVLDTARSQLGELSYRAEGEQLRIFLKAKQGKFTPEDVSFANDGVIYDLLVILDAQSLEDVAPVFQDNTETFYSLPKINIDNKSGNEYFGTVNLIDVTASSLAEILANLLRQFEQSLLDSAIATYLLTGIVSKTNSFQGVATTPKTLTIASQLIDAGARHQDIIKHLYKTKNFSLLKLWGRALARIKTDPQLSLLYSTLNTADFVRTDTEPHQLTLVLQEFLDNVSGFQTIALLAEFNGAISLAIAAPPHINLAAVAERLGKANVVPSPLTGMHQFIAVNLSATDLPQAEQMLLQALQN